MPNPKQQIETAILDYADKIQGDPGGAEMLRGFVARVRGIPIEHRGLDGLSNYWKIGWRVAQGVSESGTPVKIPGAKYPWPRSCFRHPDVVLAMPGDTCCECIKSGGK